MYQYNDYELLYMIQENDDTALDIMYQKYIPLIKSRILSFRIKQNSYDDFLQEGLLMLNTAINTYKMISKKTFNKYFDLILIRRFSKILKKESFEFYNIVLVENGDYLIREPDPDYKISIVQELLRNCKFSKFEEKVLNLLKLKYKSKEISNVLSCNIKQVYDATDRIKKKLKSLKRDNKDL